MCACLKLVKKYLIGGDFMSKEIYLDDDQATKRMEAELTKLDKQLSKSGTQKLSEAQVNASENLTLEQWNSLVLATMNGSIVLNEQH